MISVMTLEVSSVISVTFVFLIIYGIFKCIDILKFEKKQIAQNIRNINVLKGDLGIDLKHRSACPAPP